MLAIEPKVSTADEFQLPRLTQIWHPGYCYFIVQEDPQIATQYIGLSPDETLMNCWSSFDIRQTPAVFLTYHFGTQESWFQLNQPISEKIFQTFYTTTRHTQIDRYHETSETLSTYVFPTLSSDLQTEQSAINLFDAYRHAEFDTDIASEFTSDLDIFIQTNGSAAIRIIDRLINKQVFGENIISETLKALGRIENQDTKERRYQFLMQFIKHHSAIIRDGAVSGLSFLDDDRALPQLYMLFETETVPILKNNIQVAIRGFELS